MNKDNWIIDSGATDHITSHKHMLTEIRNVPEPYAVSMPNDECLIVSQVGKSILHPEIVLSDVLLIPGIRHNLINVSRIIFGTQNSVQLLTEGVTFRTK